MIAHPAEMENILKTMPFAAFLDVRLHLAGDELTAHLPYDDKLVGNVMIPALHGGVIGAFMEITAMAQLALSENFDHIPKPIGVTVQYLRSGKPINSFARATVKRVGRTVANVEVSAWQEQRHQRIATLQAHFLID
ncbi:PaaI family thioesterase [Asticcacaulis sp. EMRT-3]|uniref:PaaI family thioesterase n=1 Tax=Asticcacaulis sp. EMRT-3 TaxID=3040349 RepID=UPI0024AF5914|nr:PaaI family thioesterase [Asticcacaulis sp. EMRT-3]MDI7774438.1 PaaI family thioesterase [Asticcacaulis sp. EMRT-3]